MLTREEIVKAKQHLNKVWVSLKKLGHGSATSQTRSRPPIEQQEPEPVVVASSSNADCGLESLLKSKETS